MIGSGKSSRVGGNTDGDFPYELESCAPDRESSHPFSQTNPPRQSPPIPPIGDPSLPFAANARQ